MGIHPFLLDLCQAGFHPLPERQAALTPVGMTEPIEGRQRIPPLALGGQGLGTLQIRLVLGPVLLKLVHHACHSRIPPGGVALTEKGQSLIQIASLEGRQGGTLHLPLPLLQPVDVFRGGGAGGHQLALQTKRLGLLLCRPQALGRLSSAPACVLIHRAGHPVESLQPTLQLQALLQPLIRRSGTQLTRDLLLPPHQQRHSK